MINLLCIIKEFTLKVSMLLTTSIRRIYDNPKGNSRDFRIFVDRRWSRGLSKDEVKVDLWQKEMAPSNSLRKWNEFKRR